MSNEPGEIRAGMHRKIETAMVVLLSLLAVSVFFSQTGISTFGPLSLIVLLIWRYRIGYEPSLKLPMMLKWAAIAFAGSLALSVLVSSDHLDALHYFKKVQYMLFLWLLATCPLGDKSRRRILFVFFVGAIAAGLFGLYQFAVLGVRAHGFTHPVHYGGILGVASATALLALMAPSHVLPHTRWSRAFVFVVLVAALAGLVGTQTRGVWIGFLAGGAVVLPLMDRRKALIAAVICAVVVTMLYAGNKSFRLRVNSIAISLKSPTKGDFRSRIPVWKGALHMFRQSPVAGTGTGDWDEDIAKLEEQEDWLDANKIGRQTLVQAHNLYLHWLATQGLVGILALLALLVALVDWAVRLMRGGRHLGGYLILYCTVLIVVWGISEANLLSSKIVAAFTLAIGLVTGLRDETVAESMTGTGPT